VKEKIQRFGGFLAGMVMPNIGAFIAWGFVTAFFIPTGWTPNEKLAELVGPMILYLLPILIGYTGGKLVHGVRGGVVGAVATAGVIVGADIPMMLGAMIMGPLGGFLMKLFDNAIEDSIPSGFEMLINNFSAGILGMILAILANIAIGPAVEAASAVLGSGVQWLVDRRLLPLADLIIEPAKILFLNNAINHGVLSPLGVTEVAENGKSILFLLETNPGPGLGLLLAYWFAGKGLAKESAPSAIIIHFFGGIHEIYFPYVLMHPIMIIAMWAGGISADIWFMLTGAGLVATPSPGSIFAELAMTPRGAHIGVIGGILIGTAASFLVGSVILRAFPVKESEEEGEEIISTSPVAVPASK
jgi:PTS system mannitol-specific IIC component